MVPDSPLFRVSADGGEPIQVTTLAAHQTGHRAPQFLPDGRHFLYFAMGSPQVRGIYVGDLQGSAARRLMYSESAAVFGSDGYLFFVNQGTLFAQHLDIGRMELTDHPVALAEHVLSSSRAELPAVSVSKAGPIAYRAGVDGEKHQIAWFNRFGKEISKIGRVESFGVSYLSLSPDERRLAVQRTSKGNTDIWLTDLKNGGDLRFTTDPLPDIAPIWAPKGDRIIFASHVTGPFDLLQKAVDGGDAKPLLATPQPKQATDWSRDGRYLLYRSLDPESDWDIWGLRMTGDEKPFAVVRGNFEERDAQFSPDAKWIAYQSNESGQFEIYLQRFPVAGEKMRVSDNGGTHVRWRRDGSELFYLALDGRLISVPLHFTSTGSIQTGPRAPLFFANVGPVQDTSQNYVVSSDGQRFLIDTVVEEAPSPIRVVLNWQPSFR
jgi:Tol biopolymer transport system component